MRIRCSFAAAIVATFAVLAAGTQVTAQETGRQIAYKPTASDFVVVCRGGSVALRRITVRRASVIRIRGKSL